MGSGSSSYNDYYDDDDYDNYRYSRQTPGHNRPRVRGGRPVREIEEHHVERRHSPVVQPHTRTVITERRSPPPSRTVITEKRPPRPVSPVVHREIIVKEEPPQVITTRRSPVQVERVVHKNDVPVERAVREMVHKRSVQPERVVREVVHERIAPERLTPERIVRHHVVRERMDPDRVDQYDYDYDDRTRPTTARYYEDRDPASWYRRERSNQREKVRQTVDKRRRHQDVVNSLYRDGTVDDHEYRRSWSRRY